LRWREESFAKGGREKLREGSETCKNKHEGKLFAFRVQNQFAEAERKTFLASFAEAPPLEIGLKLKNF
jgi:hypothetical protein